MDNVEVSNMDLDKDSGGSWCLYETEQAAEYMEERRGVATAAAIVMRVR